jgi:predicted acylesterase/phospholipase RssA/CRP-like cAMP-binding protein
VPSSQFLRNVPVLAGLSRDLLAQISREVTELRVPAGEWILREGEEADSLYIIRSGRVEVLDEGPPEALIRMLRRGDVLGELALLRQGTRSASARARRDTELLELRRQSFEELIQTAPSFALGLTRAMGAQLAASRSPVVAATPPHTIAVIGLDPAAPAAELSRQLTDALAGHESVAHLDAGELANIDRAAAEAQRVVLLGGRRPDEEWTGLCLREAELILAVTSGRPADAWLAHAMSLRGCELMVLGDAPGSDVLDALEPREVQLIRERSRLGAAVAATARRLAGRSPGIVLSGGGARAFAHLGVLEELQAAGLHLDRIAGVSLGSLVAGGAAMELGPEELYEAFTRYFVAANPTNDYALPAFSLIRGGKARRMLEDAFGERLIEELPRRFFCVSCDLVARETVVHRTGPMVDAIYPSFAIPAVFPPVATADGRLLVDGGVLDNLPVATMARTGEGPVIAVDVTGRMGQAVRPRRPRAERLGRAARLALTGSETAIPRLGETILRTVMVGSSDTSTAARLHADLVIAPQVDGVALMDWSAIDRSRELGRRAAHDALAGDPELAKALAI